MPVFLTEMFPKPQSHCIPAATGRGMHQGKNHAANLLGRDAAFDKIQKLPTASYFQVNSVFITHLRLMVNRLVRHFCNIKELMKIQIKAKDFLKKKKNT